MANTQKKLSKKEIAWYVIAAIIGVVAITFLVFGIVGDHFPGVYEDNWIAESENGWLKAWSGLGYRWWGVILFVLAAALAALVLGVSAKETDRDAERAARRAQRLAMTQNTDEASK